MKSLAHVLVVIAAGGLLSACSVLSNAKRPPDEFSIVTKTPLAVPPDYKLRPPRPGEAQPKDLDPQGRAISALFPNRTRLPQASRAEQNLLRLAGATETQIDVRSNVGDGKTVVVEKGTFLRDVLVASDGVYQANEASVERVASTALDPEVDQ